MTTYLPRTIDADLLKWKDAPRPKPLLVRAASQVGKSWAIRDLWKSFPHFHEDVTPHAQFRTAQFGTAQFDTAKKHNSPRFTKSKRERRQASAPQPP